MYGSTRHRVQQHTSSRVNEAIAERTEESVMRCAAEGRRAIDARLEQLDQEWDVERVLEANFASVVLVGTSLALSTDRRWALLPAVAAGFMLQHVLQGWCPPVPIVRRLGFRTAAEIAHERYALKALRGDFDTLHKRASSSEKQAQRALRAAEQ